MEGLTEMLPLQTELYGSINRVGANALITSSYLQLMVSNKETKQNKNSVYVASFKNLITNFVIHVTSTIFFKYLSSYSLSASMFTLICFGNRVVGCGTNNEI